MRPLLQHLRLSALCVMHGVGVGCERNQKLLTDVVADTLRAGDPDKIREAQMRIQVRVGAARCHAQLRWSRLHRDAKDVMI